MSQAVRTRVRKVAGEVVQPPPPAEKVGYRKPPKAYQFKPGQSGNPKGRPPGSKSFSTIVTDLLNSTVQVRQGGKAKRMKKREAMALRLLERALSGDVKAFEAIRKLDKAEAGESFTTATGASLLTEGEEEILSRALGRLSGEAPANRS